MRFARLIHRRARDLGGPSARAAFGGNLKPALVATQGDMGASGPAVYVRAPLVGLVNGD
jgi:hypothetical protein